MYCPICGSVLEIRNSVLEERRNFLRDQFGTRDFTDKEYEEMDGIDPFYGEAKLCFCPKGHFGEGFPLIYHHPIKGLKSAPGDSFSLSWVE